VITVVDKKETGKPEGKAKATVSNNGPLFDYRRDKVCD